MSHPATSVGTRNCGRRPASDRLVGSLCPMPRPIWNGSISFGLVNVPVKLFSAVSQQDVRFHQLHGSDGGRIKQKRVCSLDGAEVPYQESAKGYEIGAELVPSGGSRGCQGWATTRPSPIRNSPWPSRSSKV